MRLNCYKTIIDHVTSQVSLVKEKGINYPNATNLQTPERVVEAVDYLYGLRNLAEEHIYLAAFNTKCKPVGFFEVGHGTINECHVEKRDIFVRALLIGASFIIVIHNHPSGDPAPSKSDLEYAGSLKQICECMGIKLLDFIIVGNDVHYSFAEYGLLTGYFKADNAN